mmetsp:Transcript_3669/g.12797  ORF Transcript_3669/g.12797 Transcript_3669/m.12797 type:complete len:182 (-) Transcript_3669:2059-2604(-)
MGGRKPPGAGGGGAGDAKGPPSKQRKAAKKGQVITEVGPTAEPEGDALARQPKRPRVYLSGPEYLLPLERAKQVAAGKRRVCAAYGLEGVFPLDEVARVSELSPQEAGNAVATKRENAIRRCDLLVANLTPFRGASADAGAAYEMGFARGLSKPAFGYTNDVRLYAARAEAAGAAAGAAAA